MRLTSLGFVVLGLVVAGLAGSAGGVQLTLPAVTYQGDLRDASSAPLYNGYGHSDMSLYKSGGSTYLYLSGDSSAFWETNITGLTPVAPDGIGTYYSNVPRGTLVVSHNPTGPSAPFGMVVSNGTVYAGGSGSLGRSVYSLPMDLSSATLLGTFPDVANALDHNTNVAGFANVPAGFVQAATGGTTQNVLALGLHNGTQRR